MVQRFDIANVGCAERIWRQAEELHRRGHSITLVNFPHAERRAQFPRLRPDAPPGVEVLDLDRRAAAMPRNYRKLRERLREADLVHLWKPYPDTALPVLHALRRHARPLHYDWDDLEGGQAGVAARLTGSRMAGKLIAFWEREILEWADTVSVASGAIREMCLRWGFPEERVRDCPVGSISPSIDSELNKRWKERLNGHRAALLVGQLESEDFPVSVLAGVAAATQEMADLLFVVVGDGSARAALEEEAARFGLQDRCLFTGYVSREEVHAILANATVFLFPLRDDLMSRCKSPLVVVEAMAHGLPIVASAVGEVPVLLSGGGALVEGLEAEAWRDALVRILGDPALTLRLGNSARTRFFEALTWPAVVDRLEEAYRIARRLDAARVEN